MEIPQKYMGKLIKAVKKSLKMFKKNRIAVAVPCYNEQEFIRETLTGLPGYIDNIYVVDDCSNDSTKTITQELAKKNRKIHLIKNKENKGIGFSVLAAFQKASNDHNNIVCVLAGDNQMNPKYLPSLLNEIIDKKYDYAKGNRFYHLAELNKMPMHRIIGNIFITFVTKICTGYWSISDPLNGYTALSLDTFKKIDPTKISQRYDFESSVFVELSMIDARIKDVFIPANYGREKSDISLLRDSGSVIRTLLKGYLKRIVFKYTLFNFHPIALFYVFGYLFIVIGIIFGLSIVFHLFGPETATTATVMLSVVPFITGFQLILQAIVLDIQNEPK